MQALVVKQMLQSFAPAPASLQLWLCGQIFQMFGRRVVKISGELLDEGRMSDHSRVSVQPRAPVSW